MAYYRRIRDMREDHDLTQRQLAAILKMPQSQYNRYEQGLRDIPTVTLIQLADLYHTSTDYLLGLNRKSGISQNINRELPCHILLRCKRALYLLSYFLSSGL